MNDIIKAEQCKAANNIPLMIYYYHNNINTDSMYALGCHYETINNFPLMKYYYLKAIKYKHVNAMMKLAKYYEKQEINNKLMIYYLEKAVKCNHEPAMAVLGSYHELYSFDYDLMRYYYNMIKNKNDYIIDAITKYADHAFLIKNKKAFSKNEECPICMTEVVILPYDCFAHYICIKCYAKLAKCPYCKFAKHQHHNNDINSSILMYDYNYAVNWDYDRDENERIISFIDPISQTLLHTNEYVTIARAIFSHNIFNIYNIYNELIEYARTLLCAHVDIFYTDYQITLIINDMYDIFMEYEPLCVISTEENNMIISNTLFIHPLFDINNIIPEIITIFNVLTLHH